jgi:hypothetical protein
MIRRIVPLSVMVFVVTVFIFRCGPGLKNPSLVADLLALKGATPDRTPDGLPPEATADTILDASRQSGGGERVTRLTPEQMSSALRESFAIGAGVYDGADLVIDYVLTDFQIPLGGLSLSNNVRRRDRLSKVQTILVSRQVAWNAARNLIYREDQTSIPGDSLFTKCSYIDDWPDKNAAAKARWTAQLQDFFRRLYGRDATAAEVDEIATTFTTVHEREGTTSAAWLVVFYAMISTMEAWNTWR